MDVTTPATGKVIAKVALSSADDVDAAVKAAQTAFPHWSGLTVKARATVLYKFRELCLKYRDELADLVVLEHGKNRAEAFGSIDKGLETVEWACSLPQLAQGKILEVSTGVWCHDTREAIGIVASIVPFNFPFMVPMWTLPICIGMGNCYILKPSEKVPLTMHRVMSILKEAGVPDGVVNIVNGTAPVVNALCDHPGIAAVTFVGSSRVAELVHQRARKNNKRVIALGGAKNHMVAVPDCSVDMCSQDIVNSYTGCAGQRCMAASVLLTIGKQADLLQAIVEKSRKVPKGQASGQMGPVIDDEALKRITKYIEESEAGGAKILVDGRPWTKEAKEGWWIGPTVILHSNPADRALHDEIFGPVLSILEVESKEKAIEIENKNPYGNAACVYTNTGGTADWFAKRFSVGMVGVNIGVPVPREPFSFGGSNISKFGDCDITGDGAMEFFSKRKKVTTKWNPAREKSWMS
jgi:methylmalonic acid semialdehyde dehydrogenase